MKNSRQVFLKLVRLGLGTTEEDLPKQPDWEAIEALAVQHGLLGVVVDGIQRLKKNQSPSQLIWLQWIGMMMQNEAQYAAQQKAAIELAQLFHDNGIRTYVLKGAIVAECYPKPTCRLSADFDCFLLSAEGDFDAWERGNKLLEDAGFEVKRNFYKNSTISVPGLMVENHRYLTAFRGDQRLVSFEKMLQSYLFDDKGGDRMDGTCLYRPPVMVSALFLIQHAYSHFLHDGLTWRYVLDWVMFSEKHKAEIDWREFNARIDEFGFRKFYEVFNGIGQDAFGNTYNSQLKAKMLADIWADKKRHKSVSGFRGKLGLAANTWRARWKYHYFSPISMPQALWIQVKGYLFDKNPKLS